MAQTAPSHLIGHATLSSRVAHVWPPSLIQAPNRRASGVFFAEVVENVSNHRRAAVWFIRVVEHSNRKFVTQIVVSRTAAKQQRA